MDLDLHGVKHTDVASMVENHIGLNTPPYKIITGNSLQMQHLVRQVLIKHEVNHLIWRDNLGSFSII